MGLRGPTARVLVVCVANLLLLIPPLHASNPRSGPSVAVLETRLQWMRYRKRLSAITTDGEAVASRLGLLPHEFTLSRTQVERGLAYQGSLTPLRGLMRKLMDSSAAQPLNMTIGLVGGPITCASGGQGHAWLDHVTSALETAYPHARFQAVDTCLNGTGYEVQQAETCVSRDLPVMPDLLLLELTSVQPPENSFMKNDHFKVLEQLIRRVLEVKEGHQPAVMMLHLLRAEQTGALSAPVTPVTPITDQDYHSYIHTYEDMMSTTAQYYDLPFLSLRDSLWVDVDDTARQDRDVMRVGRQQEAGGETAGAGTAAGETAGAGAAGGETAGAGGAAGETAGTGKAGGETAGAWEAAGETAGAAGQAVGEGAVEATRSIAADNAAGGMSTDAATPGGSAARDTVVGGSSGGKAAGESGRAGRWLLQQTAEGASAGMLLSKPQAALPAHHATTQGLLDPAVSLAAADPTEAVQGLAAQVQGPAHHAVGHVQPGLTVRHVTHSQTLDLHSSSSTRTLDMRTSQTLDLHSSSSQTLDATHGMLSRSRGAPMSWSGVLLPSPRNQTHLTSLGHRAAADLVLWALHQAALSVVMLPTDTDDPRLVPLKGRLPPPILPSNEPMTDMFYKILRGSVTCHRD